jgi:polyhydroxyalkanoate synthase
MPPPVQLDPKDRRFADRTWSQNPAFYSLRMSYRAFAEFMDQMVTAAGLERIQETKARLLTGLMVDALAPTNFLPTNPAALKCALETGGASLARDARNFLDDQFYNNGRPRQVDARKFALGQNLAATPCQVVYRNDLMELLQYSAQTAQVHAAPLLCSPPWINKYYVMDLAPGRSFIEWAVKNERTVFAISYRNPSAEMSDITMDDYLIHGPQQALDVIQEITGAVTVDIVGLCLGGALTAITDAYLTAAGEERIGTLTLLNTLLDYSEPGVLGAFTDEEAVSRLDKQTARDGHLAGATMAGTFDILRANDLIFSYVASNWLMGQDPRPSTSWPGTLTAPGCPRPCIRSICVTSTWRTGSPKSSWRSRAGWYGSAMSSALPTSSAPRTTTSSPGGLPMPRRGCCRGRSDSC